MEKKSTSSVCAKQLFVAFSRRKILAGKRARTLALLEIDLREFIEFLLQKYHKKSNLRKRVMRIHEQEKKNTCLGHLFSVRRVWLFDGLAAVCAKDPEFVQRGERSWVRGRGAGKHVCVCSYFPSQCGQGVALILYSCNENRTMGLSRALHGKWISLLSESARLIYKSPPQNWSMARFWSRPDSYFERMCICRVCCGVECI